ncbi:hypothetical protein [Haliangium sp.]
MRAVATACLLAWVPACLSISACAGDDVRTLHLTRIVPAGDPECGRPPDGRLLLVEALGDFPASEATARSLDLSADAVFDVAGFPGRTRVLSVEVLGAGGVVSAAGKSLPLVLDELPDGAQVPLFMAPVLGACPTGPPLAERVQPLAAATSDGVLVLGGSAPDGAPVHLVERYDPASGRFEAVVDRLYGTDELGLLGASATALSDGRVLVAGGPASAYQLYDPVSGDFSPPLFLNPGRAYHAAVALGPSRVLLAGGCASLTPGGACDSGTALVSTSIIDLDAGTVTDGPPLSRVRIGGMAVREGAGAVLLTGGFDAAGVPVTDAERLFPPASGAEPSQDSELVAGVGAVPARMPSGSVLTAFAGPGGEASADFAVIPAGAIATGGAGIAPATRAGVTLTALEDGQVLALGGAPDGSNRALLYEPIRGRFRAFAVPGMILGASPALGPPVPAHVAVRLDDGSVLVLGGRDPDADGSRAWRLRPELTGPFAGDVSAAFTDRSLAALAIPRDPARGSFVVEGDGGYYELRSSASTSLPSEWLVLAGPIFERVRVSALIRAGAGAGLAVLLGFRGPDDHTAVILAPGQPARLLRIQDGVVAPVEPCDATIIDSGDLTAGAASVPVELDLDPGVVRVRLGGAQVLACTGIDPVSGGHVGLGVIGAAGDALRIDTLSARRPEP